MQPPPPCVLTPPALLARPSLKTAIAGSAPPLSLSPPMGTLPAQAVMGFAGRIGSKKGDRGMSRPTDQLAAAAAVQQLHHHCSPVTVAVRALQGLEAQHYTLFLFGGSLPNEAPKLF